MHEESIGLRRTQTTINNEGSGGNGGVHNPMTGNATTRPRNNTMLNDRGITGNAPVTS